MRHVIAATEFIGGELVICKGDALGPIVARFPRTKAGMTAATAALPEEKPAMYGVWCEVWGGVTGSRSAWLKAGGNGERATFDTRDAAEREAAELTARANGPNARASFRYTAKELD